MNNKQQSCAIEVFPAISLIVAWLECDKLNSLVAQGISPRYERRKATAATQQEEHDKQITSKMVALEWHAATTAANCNKTRQGIMSRLSNHP